MIDSTNFWYYFDKSLEQMNIYEANGSYLRANDHTLVVCSHYLGTTKNKVFDNLCEG